MDRHEYTVEELMLDDSFKSYCLNGDRNNTSHWQTIVNDHPDQAEIFEEAKNLIISLNGSLGKTEINRQIEKVRRLLSERNKKEPEEELVYEPSLSDNYVITGAGIVKRLSRRRIIAYAAAACMIGIIGYLFFYQEKSTGKLQDQLAITSYQTPLGQRQTINLPDGSEVILNSNSSLSYKSDFNKNKREIELNGDAFFKVAKNPEKPFTVTSENISTTALGTQFFIHSHTESGKEIIVELLEGKVKVVSSDKNSKKSKLILYPGQKAESRDGINLEKESFDSTYSRSWIDGIIVFDKTPASDALKQLEKWYDIQIDVKAKGLDGYLINGKYKNAPLQDILKVICFSINRHFTVSGNRIMIE